MKIDATARILIFFAKLSSLCWFHWHSFWANEMLLTQTRGIRVKKITVNGSVRLVNLHRMTRKRSRCNGTNLESFREAFVFVLIAPKHRLNIWIKVDAQAGKLSYTKQRNLFSVSLHRVAAEQKLCEVIYLEYVRKHPDIVLISPKQRAHIRTPVDGQEHHIVLHEHHETVNMSFLITSSGIQTTNMLRRVLWLYLQSFRRQFNSN